MSSLESEFGGLLLITLLAVVVPIVAGRVRVVRLPVVAGGILAGAGLTRPGLARSPEYVNLLDGKHAQ